MKKLMKNRTKPNLPMFAIVCALSIWLAACSDASDSKESYKVNMEATDAPIDNAEVSAVFVTVSEIRIDGQKVEGFNKTTLEVSALTNGKTEALKEIELDNQSFSQITLVLDYEADAKGDAPGCYILKSDGIKDKITSSTNEINIEKEVGLIANATTNVVLDFDLRKFVAESSGDYEIVTASEIDASVRAAIKTETAKVKGKLSDSTASGHKTIAYLYKKGSYNLATETKGSGQSNIEFANAVSSVTVDGSGQFQFSFVDAGKYELHVFEYRDEDKDGEFTLYGKVQLGLIGGLSIDGFDVDANADVSLDAKVTGVLKL